MADAAIVRKNVRRMIEGGAPESEIQEYMAMEGATPEFLRNAGKKTSQSSSVADPGLGVAMAHFG